MTTSRLLCLPILIAIVSIAHAKDRSVMLVPTAVAIEQASFSPYFTDSTQTSITTPMPAPDCPDGTNLTVAAPHSSIVLCQWNTLSGAPLANIKRIMAKAVLKTSSGFYFGAWIMCGKQYGICPTPKVGTIYQAQLSQDARWLPYWSTRIVNGEMKLHLRVDGKKSVTYPILTLKALDPSTARAILASSGVTQSFF